MGFAGVGSMLEHRLLLGPPENLNVHAYLLLSRVCHVVHGSFPTHKVHLFLFFRKTIIKSAKRMLSALGLVLGRG